MTHRDYELQRADADLARVLDQLHQPDEVKVAGLAVGCAAVGEIVPVFGLVDAHGTVVRPRFPLGVCGLIQPEVQAAVNGLAWKTEARTETKVTPIPGDLTKDEPGCPDTAQFLLEWPQPASPEPWSKVRHPSVPQPVLMCVYTAEDSTTPESVGTLVGGLKLTPDQNRAVDKALADASNGAYSPPRCGAAQQPLFVAIGAPGDLPYLADLQGCVRLRYPNGYLAAPPPALADILHKIAIS